MAHRTIRGSILYTSKAFEYANPTPLDRSVRPTVGDKFEGSGWMRFSDDTPECQTWNARDGRISQVIATGPMFFRLNFSIVYIGEEDISVKAGDFRARHFQVTDTAGNLPEEHPPYDVWCTADDDYLLLRAGAGGYMQTHYELVDYARQG